MTSDIRHSHVFINDNLWLHSPYLRLVIQLSYDYIQFHAILECIHTPSLILLGLGVNLRVNQPYSVIENMPYIILLYLNNVCACMYTLPSQSISICCKSLFLSQYLRWNRKPDKVTFHFTLFFTLSFSGSRNDMHV